MPATAPDDDADASDPRWHLLHALADGRRHTLAALDDDRAMLMHRLASLQATGMPIHFDADGVIAMPFVPLSAEAIGRRLDAAWAVRVVYGTASTNSDLLTIVRRDGAGDRPRLLAAELQNAGRGRLGRVWRSAPGVSLTVSFALPIERPLSRLDGVTLACGLALRDALCALGADARLKWPNDLLIDDRKLAGILVEAHAIEDTTVLVIGIGLNVAPSAITKAATLGGAALAATDLQSVGGETDRNAIVARIATTLRTSLDRFAHDGFGAFVDRWNGVDAMHDRAVTLHSTTGVAARGIARGVDGQGALLVDIEGIRQRIIAGEVSVRPERLAEAVR